MPDSLVLLRPSANRVYAADAARLAAAELAVLLGVDAVTPTTLAGVEYLRIAAGHGLEDAVLLSALGRLSACYAAFRQPGEHTLEPVAVPRPDRLDDDLVGIPKYPGKTNEQFTRLLLNVTLAAARTTGSGPWTVLDPMCGRGTTLSTAWTLGHPAYGVEIDRAAVEAYATFLKTYLRRKRLKHTVEVNPLRREGKNLGSRLSATLGTTRDEGGVLELGVLTGDTRDSAALWGKKRFDVVVTDAPYGVVHGASRAGGRGRSAADLLAEAVPGWAGQLKPGGALGISWNTYHLSREDLVGLVEAAGLRPCDDGPWVGFGHRVDSSVYRDVLVATRPAG